MVQQPPLVQQPPAFAPAPMVEAPVAFTPPPEFVSPPPPPPPPAPAPMVEAPPPQISLSDPIPYIAPPRPVPPPAEEDQVPFLERQLAAHPFVPTTQPLSPGAVEASAVTPAMAPAPDGAAPDVAPDGEANAGPMWPCPKCGNLVSMTLDHCNACGAGFLEQARQGRGVHVPVIGTVGPLTSGQKLILAAGVGIGLMVVIIVLAYIGGKLI